MTPFLGIAAFLLCTAAALPAEGAEEHQVEVKEVPFTYGSEEADLSYLMRKLDRLLGESRGAVSPEKAASQDCAECTHAAPKAVYETVVDLPSTPRQNNPLKLFGLEIPLNLKTRAERSLRLSLSSGNTFILPVELKCKTGDCSRTMNLDFVGDRIGLSVSKPLDASSKNEFGMSFNVYVLNRGNEWFNPLHLLTSDSLIEGYHSRVLGQHDKYGRQAAGYNGFAAELKDRNDRTLKFEDGKLYALPLELRYTRYASLLETSRWAISANATANTGVPTNLKLKDSFSVAISSGIQATRKLGKQWSTTFATGGGVSDDELGHLKKNEYRHTDRPYQWAYTFLIGFNRADDDAKDSTQYYFSTNSTSAPFDKDLYQRPRAAPKGESTPKTRGFNAGTANTHFFTLGIVRVIRSKDGKKTKIEFSCNDDFEPDQVIGLHGLGGNNGEDFGCGVSVQRNF